MQRDVSFAARARVALVAAALAVAMGLTLTDLSQADGPGWGVPAIVALGDSYISGEAGRWAGNTNLDYSKTDALTFSGYYDALPEGRETIAGCHRSQSAEIFISSSIYIKNLACSGARTATSWSGDFKPGLDFFDESARYPSDRPEQHQGQLTTLRRYAADHNVKMLAVSIGGNDFEFASVVQNCVLHFDFEAIYPHRYCKDESGIAGRVTGWGVTQAMLRIREALSRINQAMTQAGYTQRMYAVLLQDYPSPIPRATGMRYGERGYTRHQIGGCGLWDADVDWANDIVIPNMSAAVREAVNGSGLTNVKLMNLTSAFTGRRLCENTVGLLEEKGLASWRSAGAVDASEWISQIRVYELMRPWSRGQYYLQEDFHPNYWGQLALRSCVRQAYNGGTPRGGTCTRTGTGLTGYGEPVMTLR